MNTIQVRERSAFGARNPGKEAFLKYIDIEQLTPLLLGKSDAHRGRVPGVFRYQIPQ